MSGLGHLTRWIGASGDSRIDGILGEDGWDTDLILYATPEAALMEDLCGYGSRENLKAITASADLRAAAHAVLDRDDGNAANDGFSVEGVTAAAVEQAGAPIAHLRVFQTRDHGDSGTAWAYLPAPVTEGGDIWFSTARFDYGEPRPGNYAWLTLLHETGHALGLEHGHADTDYGKLPKATDFMEYSVMTYRSFVDADTGSLKNGDWSFAQSFMMYDIAALQYVYGADFATNAGRTVYRWEPDRGHTLVDGATAIDPGVNRIFATIWDGGGRDRYDLSAYDTDLSIDLRPGGHSVFSDRHLADLGHNTDASGSI